MNSVKDNKLYEACTFANLSGKVKLLFYHSHSKELIKRISKLYLIKSENLNDFVVKALKLDLGECLIKAIKLNLKETVDAILLEDNLFSILLRLEVYLNCENNKDYNFELIEYVLDNIFVKSLMKDKDDVFNMLFENDYIYLYFDMEYKKQYMYEICDRYNSVKCAKIIYKNTSDKSNVEMFFQNENIIRQLNKYAIC